MKKRVFILFIPALLLNSCYTSESTLVYSRNPSVEDFVITQSEIDFSKGEWLLNEIDVNSEAKDDLTKMVIDDFQNYLDQRLKYSLNQKSLLLATMTALHPTKKQIEDLKKTTGFDYFINIKCHSGTTDLSNFNWTVHSYFKAKKNYATLVLEIYDLNLHEIIYSQASECSLDQAKSITNNTKFAIKSCYKKVFQNMKNKIRKN